MLVFFAGTVVIRFIGTPREYDKIKDLKTIWVMIIKNEKEYKDYEARAEKLMQRGSRDGSFKLWQIHTIIPYHEETLPLKRGVFLFL